MTPQFIFTHKKKDTVIKRIGYFLIDAVRGLTKQHIAEVSILNDNYNTPEYVCYVLCEVLDITYENANKLMLKAHSSGTSSVFYGREAVARRVAKSIAKAGPDPRTARMGATSIDVKVKVVTKEN